MTRPGIRLSPSRRALRARAACCLVTLPVWCLVAALSAWGGEAAADQAEAHEHRSKFPHVLILNSYHLGYQWSDDEMTGLIEILQHADRRVEAYVEYLDCKRFPKEEHFPLLAKLFDLKFPRAKPDVLIAADNPALEFALKHRRELFPNAPLVFCGINGFTPELLAGHTRVTGVAEVLDVGGTLDAAFRLYPATRQVVLLNDYTVTGMATRHETDLVLPRFAGRATFRYVDYLPMARILDDLGSLGPGDLVVILSFANDQAGQVFDHPVIAEIVSAHCRVPVFAVHEARLGHGIVGGSLLSGRMQGARAAEVALQVLGGKDIGDIPVEIKSTSRLMFDYAQMARFGILPENLPEGSVVINRPRSFYQEHRQLVLSTLAVVAGLTAVVLILTFNILRRRRAEAALAESEKRYRGIFDDSPISLWEQDRSGVKVLLKALVAGGVTDVEAHLTAHPDVFAQCLAKMRVLDVNRAALELLEAHNKDELLRGWPSCFVPEAGAGLRRSFAAMAAGQTAFEYEAVLRTLKGARKHVVLHWSAAPGQETTLARVLLSIADVTARRRAEEQHRKLEAQIQQTQRLESLGVLAGGIAHDFNNLLTGVLGYASMALQELSPASPARDSVRHIETSARRAAELTGQLLAYSGKGRFVVEPIRFSELVAEMGRLLEVSISKKCVVRYQFADNEALIEADVSQMRQVVMNLIINASEAIGDKDGLITARTGVMDCDRVFLAETYLDQNLPAGRYVYLEVADNGCGMTPEVRERIFEPFFTTKFTGRGLGLAAVLGIVRGHRGAIKVYSEPGRGTTFTVFFPASAASAVPADTRKAEPATLRGTGTVLIVEDEEAIRTLAERILGAAGFAVLTAADGREGVEVFRTNADRVNLVLLDMTMPRMNGVEAFRAMQAVRPGVRVILSSGYNEQHATQDFVGRGLAGFIQKPYTVQELRDAVQKVLGNA